MKLIQEKFGSLQYTRIENNNNESIAFTPEFGAVLNECNLKFGNQFINIIDGYLSEDELVKQNKSFFKSSILSPYPNRINAGKYTFNDKSYQLPINFPQEGHSIHGFLDDQVFEQFDIKEEEDSILVMHRHIYLGKNEGYPFPFIQYACYEFDEAGNVMIASKIENTGNQPMPIGAGWHHYFKIGDVVDDLVLKLPQVQQFQMGANMIPTQERTTFNQFISPAKIGNIKLDDCFELQKKEKQNTVSISKDEIGFDLLIESEFKYLQLFTPPHRKSIAIEPMSCIADSFNTGVGLIVLNPGESKLFKFYIKKK